MTIVPPNTHALQPFNAQKPIQVTDGQTTMAISAGQVADQLFHHLKTGCVGNAINLGENSGLPRQTLGLLGMALTEFQGGQVNIRDNKSLAALARQLSKT